MTIELEAWSERAVALSPERAATVDKVGLVRVLPDEPPERWRLAADSRVGVVCGDGWEIRVTPKLAVPQLMFLLSYAADPRGWRDIGPAFAAEDDLFTAVAAAFAIHAERALSPAPIRGYVNREDRSTILRGRLRMPDQLARWPAQPTPLEIAHDEFTADIPENRLVRGATELLLRMPLLPFRVRRRLLRIRATLEDVTPSPRSASIDLPPLTRLNVRYRGALALARLILQGCSISTRVGETGGVSFVFDMNRVFEDFLSTALRASIERYGGRLDSQNRREHLDLQKRIRLIPDLTWWKDGTCRAVIDAKYKPLMDERFPNADAYQMLAYCTALDLDRGYLVYAKDAGEAERNHTIKNASKVIHVRAIDVEQPPADVLAHVDELALGVAKAGRRPRAATSSTPDSRRSTGPSPLAATPAAASAASTPS